MPLETIEIEREQQDVTDKLDTDYENEDPFYGQPLVGLKIKNENDISVEVDVLQPIRPRGNRKELAVYVQEILHKNLSQNLS